MSSNIKVERICEWCGKKFIAQTTVTSFCSKRCSEHPYKERMRQKNMALSNQETCLSHQTKHKDKDFLTPTETAHFLGVGRTYIYDCINRGQIKVMLLLCYVITDKGNDFHIEHLGSFIRFQMKLGKTHQIQHLANAFSRDIDDLTNTVKAADVTCIRL